jgi:hypothetical protein
MLYQRVKQTVQQDVMIHVRILSLELVNVLRSVPEFLEQPADLTLGIILCFRTRKRADHSGRATDHHHAFIRFRHEFANHSLIDEPFALSPSGWWIIESVVDTDWLNECTLAWMLLLNLGKVVFEENVLLGQVSEH